MEIYIASFIDLIEFELEKVKISVFFPFLEVARRGGGWNLATSQEKCQVVVSKCQVVVSKCQMVVSKCQVVVSKCQVVVSKCQVVVSKCK